MKIIISFVLGLLLLSPVYAVKIEFHSFEDKEQEKIYFQLIAELRCVKCQNQNLAESNAELATDMREKTYEIIVNGGSREDVVTYMTDRYGDFVLYNPPFRIKTALLWFGPALFLFFSLFMLLKLIRKQQTTPVEKLNDADRESIRELLNSEKD